MKNGQSTHSLTLGSFRPLLHRDRRRMRAKNALLPPKNRYSSMLVSLLPYLVRISK